MILWNDPKISRWFFSGLVLLLLLLIVLVVLLPVSPASVAFPSRDSGVFLYTGWRVLHGEIPYLQIWDHKPPLIYYLDAIGLAMTPGSTWGVWLVEIVSLWLAAALGYKVLNKLYSLYVAVFISFLWLFSCFYLLAGGNLTTEYALPFQFALLFFFQKAENSRDYGWRGFVIGVVTALLFFIRQNEIAIAIAIGLFLLIKRISQREIKKLLTDSITILAGGLVVTSIIVGYFALKNALPAFWDAAFLYNFFYSDARGTMDRVNALIQGMNQLENAGLAQIALLGWGSALALLCFKTDRIAADHRSFLWVAIIALPLEFLMVSIGGRPRIPYFMALLPVFTVFAGFTIWVLMDSLLRDIPKFAGAALILMMVGTLGWVIAADYVEISDSLRQPGGDQAVIAYIQDKTNTDDYVLMWGAETSYNFATRRLSPTRFVYQTAFYTGYEQKNTLVQFLNDILSKRPKLIILTGEDKLSDFRFVHRDNQVGALMDEVKNRYSSVIKINNWQVFSDPSQ